MGGRKSLNVNLHKTTDGGVGKLGRGVGQCRCRATNPIRLYLLFYTSSVHICRIELQG